MEILFFIDIKYFIRFILNMEIFKPNIFTVKYQIYSKDLASFLQLSDQKSSKQILLETAISAQY